MHSIILQYDKTQQLLASVVSQDGEWGFDLMSCIKEKLIVHIDGCTNSLAHEMVVEWAGLIMKRWRWLATLHNLTC